MFLSSMARDHTWIIMFGAQGKKTTFGGEGANDPAGIGLADSRSRLSLLSQLSQMEEWATTLRSSRRADKKTYMDRLVNLKS